MVSDTAKGMQRAEHKDINVWGVNVRYIEAEEGPVVLLLHGLGSSLITWYCSVDPLAEVGFRVIALDLPGYGDSDKPGHLDYDAESAARFLFDFTEKLGIERLSVVGSSAGGLIVGVFALEYPERVEKLATVGSGGLGRRVSWVLRLMTLPGVEEIIYHPRFNDQSGISRRIFYRPPDFLDEILPELMWVRHLPGARSAMLRSLRSGVNFFGLRPQSNILPKLRQSAIPMVLVWGENDPVIPISVAEEARNALPKGTVFTVPECGHWPHMEKADLFNGILTGFLKEDVPDGLTTKGPAQGPAPSQ